MADADSNNVKMADESSGEQTGVALTESDMECEKVSGTTESGDQLPNVDVTADDKIEWDALTDEKIVKPVEALKSITTDTSDVAKDEMECEEIRDESEEALKSITTDTSDVAKDEMECEEIRDEPKSIDTNAVIPEESKKTAEAGAESLAHSEKKDEMECEDAADKLQSEDSKSLLKASELQTDTEEKLAKTSNDVSVAALKLADKEKGGMECVLDKLQSEDATARNSSKSVHVKESAPSDESSNDGLIIGKKIASVDLPEFLGKNYDIRKLPLPYSPSSGELADESNLSVSDSLSSISSELTRVEDVQPAIHLRAIVEDPNAAGPSLRAISSESSIYSSDTRDLCDHEITEAPKMSPSTFTSGSELVSAKNESQKPNDSVNELPKISTATTAVASSSVSVKLILPEDTKPKKLRSDDTVVDDTISVPVQNETLHELVVIKEVEVEEPERAKPVHLSPKKPQTLQTEKHIKELSTEEEKSAVSDPPEFQAEQEHSNVELPIKQDESAATTPEDVQCDVEESRSHVSVKRRINVDEEHFGGPSKKVNKKQEEDT